MPPLPYACLQVPGGLAALDDFEALFRDVDFRPGTELAFSTAADGSGVTLVRADGAALGAVRLPAFGRALFGLYLGNGSMSPGAKAEVVAGLSALLQG